MRRIQWSNRDFHTNTRASILNHWRQGQVNQDWNLSNYNPEGNYVCDGNYSFDDNHMNSYGNNNGKSGPCITLGNQDRRTSMSHIKDMMNQITKIFESIM